jgi:hypothetical protein
MLSVLRFRGTWVLWACAEVFGEDAHEGRSAIIDTKDKGKLRQNDLLAKPTVANCMTIKCQPTDRIWRKSPYGNENVMSTHSLSFISAGENFQFH